VKRYMAISQSRAPFERGSKLDRKTMLTDSRFPGTTELLSAASVALKGVRANLEEQVRIKVEVGFQLPRIDQSEACSTNPRK